MMADASGVAMADTQSDSDTSEQADSTTGEQANDNNLAQTGTTTTGIQTIQRHRTRN